MTFLASCTFQESRPYIPVSGEAQVPANAKIEPGYKYPSVPLSEFQSTASGNIK